MFDEVETRGYQTIFVHLMPKLYGERLAENPDLAVNYARSKALAGDAEGQLGWGHMLLDGYGVTKDPEAAVRWFHHAARQGNVDAWNMLGRCYEHGWGVRTNINVAEHWYGLAASKSHAWAQFNLSALLLAIKGHAADLGQILKLLVASARAGNPKAMNMLGHFREKGLAHSSKPRAAALWFRWAAQGGCFRGQFHFARFLLRDGKVTEAARWFRSSLMQSPIDFARDGAEMLARHPQEQISRIGKEVLDLREGSVG